MNRYWSILLLPFIMTGCLSSKLTNSIPVLSKNDSSGGNVENIITKGFSLPSSIETVPSNSSTEQNALRVVSSGSLIDSQPTTAISKLESNTEKTDMEKDTFSMRIWEKDLDQFQIIDQLLSALKQTRYEDSAFLNKGPYAALIRWEEDNKIEKWIVDSKIVTVNGRIANQVDFWIDNKDGLIEARFNIFAAATDLSRYGEWTAQAKMYTADKNLRGQFAANTMMNENGQAVIRVHHENMGGDQDYKFRGKLVLKDDNGSGIFDNGEKIFNYAYNNQHLLIKKDDLEITCKNRNIYEDLTLDYNVYNSDGANINRVKKFGFPLKLQGEEASNKYYYYGAYHNRHGLYTNNNESVPAEGSILLRSDNNKKEKFSFYGRHRGYLSKKIISEAKPTDIMFQILATQIHENFSIRYNAQENKFFRCEVNNQIACKQELDINALKSDSKLKKQVRLYGWNGQVDPQFLKAMDGESFWVSIDQPLYLEFDGNQWSQWSYEFPENSQEWLPKFMTKSPYSFSKSQTYFIQAQDFGYQMEVLVDNDLTTLSLKQYNEHVILPGAEAAMAGKLLFNNKWEKQEYTFDAESLDLINGEGSKVTEGKWDLLGSDGETYQWVYGESSNDNYAFVDYLMDEKGDFVFLDESIYFSPFELAGKMMTSLGYDGHMRGLPDFYRLFRDSNGELTDEIKQKITNIPFGLYSDRENSDIKYFIKPIRGIRLLSVVSPESCTVQSSLNISLDNQDGFQEFKLSDYPESDLKVVEGNII